MRWRTGLLNASITRFGYITTCWFINNTEPTAREEGLVIPGYEHVIGEVSDGKREREAAEPGNGELIRWAGKKKETSKLTSEVTTRIIASAWRKIWGAGCARKEIASRMSRGKGKKKRRIRQPPRV